MADEISKYDDIIDFRDVIARIGELESERNDCEQDDEGNANRFSEWDDANGEELKSLQAFMQEMKGNGGDEQWRGDWYPITAIRDSYFKDYAQELAEDIGAIDKNASWPNSFIDWEAAADALKQDYTTAEFDGVTYWVR